MSRTPEEKHDAMVAQHGPELLTLLNDAARVPSAKAPTLYKRIMLRQIADRLGEIVQPHTPCRKGCAHCCHQATAITSSEAQAIGRAIGRAPAKPSEEEVTLETLHAALKGNVDKYYGVACPFLKDNACSIYDVRPIECRMHHSLFDDPDPCEPTPEKRHNGIPKFDFSQVLSAHVDIALDEVIADIREFFPPKE